MDTEDLPAPPITAAPWVDIHTDAEDLATPTSTAAPWENIDPDILGKIFAHLASATDGVRASAVCRHWRATAMAYPPPLPWVDIDTDTEDLRTPTSTTAPRVGIDTDTEDLATPTSTAAPWEDIDTDILGKIFGHLASGTDRLRASAVCRHWRATAMAYPPPLPWVVMPSAAGTSYFRIFDRIEVEAAGHGANFARGTRICGSFIGGWFVIARPEPPRHALLNLLSGRMQALPDQIRVLDTSVQGFTDIPMVIQASAISAAPDDSTGSVCMIAAMTPGYTRIAFWRMGMTYWTPPLPTAVQDRVHWRMMLPPFQVEDILFHDGNFCVLTAEERLLWYLPMQAPDGALTMQLHVNALTPSIDLIPPVAARYLLMSSSGRYLLMVRRIEVPFLSKFQITTREGSAWVRLRELQNQSIFLGRCSSRAIQTGVRATVFFLDDVERYQEGRDSFRSNDSGLVTYHPQATLRCLPEREPSGTSPWSWLHLVLSPPSDAVEIPQPEPPLVPILLKAMVWLLIGILFCRIFVI